MAVVKPRTGDGPLEAVREGKKIVIRAPADGGGRLMMGLSLEEAEKLGTGLVAAAE